MSEDMYKHLIDTIGRFKYNKRYHQPQDDVIIIDPSVGPEDDRTITVRTLGLTFESIYKNIASYPNTTDISNSDFLRRTIFLENDKKIYINTDISIEGRIVTTITGDTSLKGNGLVRTIIYDVLKIDTVYSVI